MIGADARLARVLVRPRSAWARTGEPLSFGVPFARGRVSDATPFVVVDAAGQPRPTAARVVSRWSDGSVRWAFLETAADVPLEGTRLDVCAGESAPLDALLTVSGDGRRATVETAGFRAGFDCDSPLGLTALTIGGRSAVASGLRWEVHDAAAPCEVRWREVSAAPVSALTATITLRGTCTTSTGRVLAVSAACRFFAGRHALAIDVELHNTDRAQHPGGIWELGDPGSIVLRSAAVRVVPSHAGDRSLRVRARCEADTEARIVELPFAITQVSSGGVQWNSPVHVGGDGRVALAHRGYTVEAAGHRFEGLRAQPTVTVGVPGDLAMTVTAPLFWEVFPKRLGVAPDGAVEIAWLPDGTGPHEIQGGERCHFAFALGFGPDPVAEMPLEWCRAASVVLPDPQTAIASDVVPRLAPASDDDPLHARLVEAAVDGDDTFVAKRERIDEYGWRHFGDLYADHENGPDPERRRVSHYNNQYDAVAGLIVRALRAGDARWWILADDLAHHVAHIDIYWTADDKAAYNGGLFWHTAHYVDAGRSTHRSYPTDPGVHGGGPANEHCYSTGLLLHFYLTGDVLSAAAVERLADWLIEADDGAKAPAPLRWLSASATGFASSTYASDYHGPGRGPANALHAMLNAFQLTGRQTYLAKAHELVRRVVHPDDDITALRLLDTERRWSYVVMLQALARYADEMGERGDDDSAAYGRAALLHYARWMAEHEYPYLDKPELLEFPNETWAAQDFRKGDVFELAALHAVDAAERARFAERAAFFRRTALETLAASSFRSRTRPVILLLANGASHAWHRIHGSRQPFGPPINRRWPARRPFVAQRTIAVRRLAGLAAAGVAAMAAAVTALWL